MAIRTPLKIDSTNLKEMSTANRDNIIARMVQLYLTTPSVNLSVVGSSGSLAAITDTRMQAGASTTDVTNFDSAGETPNVSTVTVTYDKITSANSSVSAAADTNNIRFPVYNDGGNVKAMTLTDMYDSFVSLATNGASTLLPASQPYKIHTSTSVPSGYTLVSSTPVFSDTRANVGAYTAGGIGETRDQPTTISNYYLHKRTGSLAAYTNLPLYIDANQNLKEYTTAELDVVLKEVIRYASVHLTSNKLRFYIGGSGTTCGTGMANTKLNGSGNYQQRYVNANDYRTQEFPNGSVVTEATYYLKARKE
jgi:hypothetical protein